MARTKQAKKGKSSEPKHLRKKLTTKRNSLNNTGKVNLLSLSNKSATVSNTDHEISTRLSLPTLLDQSSDASIPTLSQSTVSAEKSVTSNSIEPGYARKSFGFPRARKSCGSKARNSLPTVPLHKPNNSNRNEIADLTTTSRMQLFEKLRLLRETKSLASKISDTTTTSQTPKKTKTTSQHPLRRSLRVSGVGVDTNISTISKSKSPKARAKRVFVPHSIVRRRKPGTLALQEIRHYQKDGNLLLMKLPFQRLIREILQGLKSDFYIQKDALLALQEASEIHLVDMFERSNLCAIHDKRVTLFVKDMMIVKTLNS